MRHYLQTARTGHAREREAGHAVVEMAMMSPWIFLLFIMVFDLGFYNYAAIATANAARSGMMYTTQSGGPVYDVATLRPTVCLIALRELRGMPNVPGTLSSCAPNAAAVTDATPVAVEMPPSCTGPDSQACSTVAVTYRSPQLFPIPGLMGRLTVTRVAEGRIRDN